MAKLKTTSFLRSVLHVRFEVFKAVIMKNIVF
jgi:hypothetical protein